MARFRLANSRVSTIREALALRSASLALKVCRSRSRAASLVVSGLTSAALAAPFSRSSTSPLRPSRRWANRPASVRMAESSLSKRAMPVLVVSPASRIAFCSSASRPASAANWGDWPEGSVEGIAPNISSSLVRRATSSCGISWLLPTLLSSALVSRASLACVSPSAPSDRPISSTLERKPTLGRVPSTLSMSARRRIRSLISGVRAGGA